MTLEPEEVAADPLPEIAHGGENPYRTVSSREVYRNPWIRVREDEIIRPDGSAGVYGVVHKPLACGVVALTQADEVVLVGQWRYPLEAYSWEIVEGAAAEGEDGAAAIRRELVEEAGYEAAHWEVLVDDVALSNSVMDEHARLWLATGLRAVPRDPDPTEVLEIRHVPFADAVAMVDHGEITDAMSVIALLALARRRARG